MDSKTQTDSRQRLQTLQRGLEIDAVDARGGHFNACWQEVGGRSCGMAGYARPLERSPAKERAISAEARLCACSRMHLRSRACMVATFPALVCEKVVRCRAREMWELPKWAWSESWIRAPLPSSHGVRLGLATCESAASAGRRSGPGSY
jgi:hypothetical protein